MPLFLPSLLFPRQHLESRSDPTRDIDVTRKLNNFIARTMADEEKMLAEKLGTSKNVNTRMKAILNSTASRQRNEAEQRQKHAELNGESVTEENAGLGRKDADRPPRSVPVAAEGPARPPIERAARRAPVTLTESLRKSRAREAPLHNFKAPTRPSGARKGGTGGATAGREKGGVSKSPRKRAGGVGSAAGEGEGGRGRVVSLKEVREKREEMDRLVRR